MNNERMQVTLVQFHPRVMGEKLFKSHVLLNSINCSNWVVRTWKMMKEAVAQDVTEQRKMLKCAESVAFR
jgi:hypothetical protein